MARPHFLIIACLMLLSVGIVPALGKEKSKRKGAGAEKPSPQKIEAATRLQIFLDRSNFAPGKIDGRASEFTWKALGLYRQSRGEPAQSSPPASKNSTLPDLNGLDLAGVDSVFISYTVSPADVQNVGTLPSSPKEQAKLKALLYRNPAEAIAEKFHCDLDFLEQLNPGKIKSMKAGDQLRVPNVEPFEVGEVQQITPGSATDAPAANDLADDAAAGEGEKSSPEASVPSVKVDTKNSMLGVFEGEKLVAAYPVTIGSSQTASPVGEWKVRAFAKWPRFRYDEQMLKRGERSGQFYMLPPGPRSPVGVLWIALNKKGIGIHGTATPDSIGRAVSHGCIRLANWDVVRLAQRIKVGTPVSIH